MTFTHGAQVALRQRLEMRIGEMYKWLSVRIQDSIYAIYIRKTQENRL